MLQIMHDKYVKIMNRDRVSPHSEVRLKSLKQQDRANSSNNLNHLTIYKHPELNSPKRSEALLRETSQVHRLQRDVVQTHLYVSDPPSSLLQSHSIPIELESQINSHKLQFK